MSLTVVIFHPEGNFNANPHLAAVIGMLCERGDRVVLYAQEQVFGQEALHAGMEVRLGAAETYRKLRGLARHPAGEWLLNRVARRQFGDCLELDADIFIGVDSLGLVLAERFSRQAGKPLGLISYELLFASETGKAARAMERRAGERVAFAVVQDSDRGAQLANEAGIDPGLMIHAPVAGRGVLPAERGWLRQQLDIPADSKIALVMGSMDAWTGFADLARSTAKWPDDWCLVAHHRYGKLADLGQWAAAEDLERIFISTASVPTSRELGALLGDVDLGIGLYYPDHAGAHSGLNLEHIGMASGKISTYLQFGVPVLVNEIGEMADHVRTHGLGAVIDRVESIPGELAGRGDKDEAQSARCHEFFSKHLDAERTTAPLLARINQLVSSRP